MRDATILFAVKDFASFISIHASHAGCDSQATEVIMAMIKFQSTHPMRDATELAGNCKNYRIISIHASHAGCDCSIRQSQSTTLYFNPRIPCGMRHSCAYVARYVCKFQSTHPMRDATSINQCRMSP